MAHYAFLDENNIVTEVITGRNEDEVVNGISDWEAHYGEFRGQRCIRTSYNTYFSFNDGVPRHSLGGTPFRGKYACIGDTYDQVNDVFVPYGWSYDFATETFTPPTPEVDNDNL